MLNSYDEVSRVRDCLEGRCEADQETIEAVSVLAERLERLKKSSHLFSRVRFSAAVGRFAQDAAVMAG
jgi:hypothetical protein